MAWLCWGDMVWWVVMQTAIIAHCSLPEKGISHHQMRLPLQETMKSLTTHSISTNLLYLYYQNGWTIFFHCLGHHCHNYKSQKKNKTTTTKTLLFKVPMFYMLILWPTSRNFQDHFLFPNRSVWTLGLSCLCSGLSHYYPRPSSDSPESLRVTRISTGSAHDP